MYVEVNKTKSGIEYVRVCESYRDENGKVCHRTVQKFGRLDRQLAQNPNFLSELKARYDDERDTRLKAAAALHLHTAAEVLSMSDPEECDDNRPVPVFQYGTMILRALWKDVLGLDTHLVYVQRAKLSIRYDLNQAASYLAFMKALDPRSVLHSYADRNEFLGAPARGLSPDDCRDCHARLGGDKAGIIRHLNRRLDAVYGKDRTGTVFLVVADVSSKAAVTGRATGLDDVTRASLADACRNGEQPLGDVFFTASGAPVPERLPGWFLQESADEQAGVSQMGRSGEQRLDQSSVSLALVLDRKAMPVAYEVCAGEGPDSTALSEAVGRLKRTYGIRDAIVVADRGPVSLFPDDVGVLAAQDVAGLDAAAAQTLLDPDGWLPISEEQPERGRYRTIPHWTTRGRGGESVECTLVLTWSEARKKREDSLLDLAVGIVRKKAEAGAEIGPRGTGWAQFARTDGGQTVLGVDEDAVARRRRLCGFAAMVFRPGNGGAAEAPSGAVLAGMYPRLTRLASFFRSMTGTRGLCPPDVRTPEQIQGHGMACFLALVLLRLLQDRLEAKGRHMGLEEISAVLNDACLLVWKAGRDVFFAPVMPRSSGGGHGMAGSGDGAGRNKGTVPGASALADILAVCNLRPVPRFSRLAEAARCLGTRWPDVKDVVPEERLAEV